MIVAGCVLNAKGQQLRKKSFFFIKQTKKINVIFLPISQLYNMKNSDDIQCVQLNTKLRICQIVHNTGIYNSGCRIEWTTTCWGTTPKFSLPIFYLSVNIQLKNI